MTITIIISSITAILLILSILLLPKIKIFGKSISTYWIVSLVGAISILLFTETSFNDVIECITSSNEANPLKILVLFFSMTFLSIFLDEIRFFSYLAKKCVKIVKSKQIALFLIIYFMVSILTVFTSNDIVILTFTPFICYFTKASKINPIPYLVGEFVAANTWSMMLLIGNPTNIYLSLSASIDFLSYLNVMWLPTICAGIVQLLILLLIFKKPLKEELNISVIEEDKLNKTDLIFGLIHLGGCLVFLILSNIIKIEMYLITLLFCCSLLIYIIISSVIRKTKFKTIGSIIKRLPFELIPFVLGMEVIVIGLSVSNVTESISMLFGESLPILKYGISSCFMCNVINNIPMSILYSSICSININSSMYLKSIYSSIIGSNIGAFLTPLGALAGIMFTSLLEKYEVKYSFKDFIKYGILIAVPTLIISLFVLFLVF